MSKGPQIAQKTRLIAFAILIGALASSVVEAAVVRFRSTASAIGALVTLADVADVTSGVPDEAAALGAIGLTPAPAPGATVRLDFDTVRARLTAQGVNIGGIEFGGSSVIVVTGPAPLPKPAPDRPAIQPIERTTPAQRQRAESLVADAIRQHLLRSAPKLGRVQIALALEQDQIAPALDGASSGFEVRGGAEPWGETQQFTLRTLDRRNEIRELTVACRLSPFPFALAARRALPRGHVIDAGDLAWRQTESTDDALVDPAQAIGKEVQAAIRAEELLKEGDLRSVPLVRSNDIVTVYARRGGISVKRQLKARSDGGLGETVTLVTPDGRQTLVARVIGFHEAELPAASGDASEAGEVSDSSGRIRFESRTRPRGPGTIVQTGAESAPAEHSRTKR